MKTSRIREFKNFCLAALLMASAMFTACSSDDDSIIEQPVNPTEPKTYTMTIRASKGDDATTRGLYFDDDSKKNLKVNWNGKEKIRVVQNGTVIGTLTAALNSTESTTLTGTVTGFQVDQAVGFYLLADENGKMDYTGQKGAMLDDNGTGNIEENYDFASCELTGDQCSQDFEVNGSSIVPKGGVFISFASQQAIVRFELQNSDGDDLLATKFIVTDKNTGKLVQSIDAKSGTKTYGQVSLTPNNNKSWVYNVALNLEDNTSDLRLFALDSDGNLYTYEKSGVTFTKGKYYRVKVKMSLCTKFPLSQITHEDTQFTGWYIGSTISDGDTENCAYNSGGSGVNAVIAYVGKVPGYFNKFLAISTHDSKKDGTEGRENTTWRLYASTSNIGAIGAYAANHPIKIGSTTYNTAAFANYNNTLFYTYDQVANSKETTSKTFTGDARIGWRMPTITDWRYIFYGLCGSPSPTDPAGIEQDISWGTSDLIAILNASPGYNLELQSGASYYCTSSGVSGVNGGNVWYMSFLSNGGTPKASYYDDNATLCYLRPVFAY
ncbi:MAG: hypothetical protein IK084_04080 [Bacteroidaceae bacterium]|nr:hypothetical protein [Bacteroidaceae bacterium]